MLLLLCYYRGKYRHKMCAVQSCWCNQANSHILSMLNKKKIVPPLRFVYDSMQHRHGLNILQRDLLIYKTWVICFTILSYRKTFSFKLSHRLDWFELQPRGKEEISLYLYISSQIDGESLIPPVLLLEYIFPSFYCMIA